MLSMPVEVWELIGSFLDNRSYHNLRCSSKEVLLPLSQLVRFATYRAIVEDCDMRWIVVRPSDYSVEFLKFLVTKKQFLNSVRFLKCRKLNSELEEWIWSQWITESMPADIGEELYRVVGLPENHLKAGWYFFCSSGVSWIVLELISRVEHSKRRLTNGFATVCAHGHLALVKAMLQDPRLNPGDVENTAIIQACKGGFIDIVKLLLEDERVDPTDDDQMALFEAMAGNHLDILELLLRDPRIDPAMDDDDLFITSCREGKLDVVQLLYKDPRVDPSSNFNQAIVDASTQGHVEIVELLLRDPRVDPSDTTTSFIEDNEALIQSCSGGHYQVVKLLLNDSRVNPSACEQQPLLLACRGGYADVAELLMDHPDFEWDLNVNNCFNEACDYDHPQLIPLFLKRHRFKQWELKEGLRIAVESGSIAVVEFLLESKCVHNPKIMEELILSGIARHNSPMVELLKQYR
jgi:ankyrin repeat protein